jgi:D-3-phosphoglycerate dehydrogenase
MDRQKLLVIGDNFILPSLMRTSLGGLAERFNIVEASTPFPLEPFRDIAEVREASGSEEQMIEALRGVAICIAHHAPLTKYVVENAPDLRLFIVCRGGPVNVNVSAATEHGIVVAYTPARNATATAEHTVAMMLSAMRLIPDADAAIRKGRWKGDYTWATVGFELESATVGLIGYGAIGHIVAHILKGFGANVLVYDPYAEIGEEEGVRQVELAELLDQSNIVSLHARETPESRGILGAEQIARLQQGSIVVNCARGSLMDYDAVAEALRSGHLFAAAADVFPSEPLASNSPLLQLPNFIMTPHIAGGTQQAAIKATRIAAEELNRYLNGYNLRYCANPQVQEGLGLK